MIVSISERFYFIYTKVAKCYEATHTEWGIIFNFHDKNQTIFPYTVIWLPVNNKLS